MASTAEDGKIRVLDVALANQIAAGEVIENPASVVKELIENSLDAGAQRITVMIDGDAGDLLRVADDGEGMSDTDAARSLERHATSKIRRAEDLACILTLGFRGEALPSIASVSHLVMVTKPRGSVAGTQIKATPGEPLEVKPTGAPDGTRIEVRDLFFNTPARRKFLKSSSAETARISEQVARLALSRPEVAFTLLRNNKPQRSFLPRTELGERAQEIVGSTVELRHADGQLGPVRVSAWLTGPERARVGARGLHLLVNGRLVRDPALLRAIWAGYDGTIDHGTYPLGVVSITIDPHLLDVNVHPQKAEVRFVDRGAVNAAVIRVVGAAVRVRDVSLAPPGSDVEPPYQLRPETPHGGSVPLPFTGWSGGATRSAPSPHHFAGLADRLVTPPDVGSMASPLRAGGYASLRYLGPAGPAWLVCEGPDGLHLIDQHAAHERVTFEKLRTSITERRPRAQQLLVPEQAEVSPEELEELAERREELAAIGFDVEPFGTTTVAIAAIPALLDGADPRRLLDEVLGEITGLRTPLAESMDRLLSRLACHGSVRAGTRLSPAEVDSLLHDLDAADLGGHCPHGRPVSFHLSWAEVERRLGRR